MYSPVDVFWWGANRNIGTKMYDWSRYTRIFLYNTPVDVEVQNPYFDSPLYLFYTPLNCSDNITINGGALF
jgi:hypothetical protein